MNPFGIIDKCVSWLQIVKSLPMDGGPSATRWVFIRTSEVISFGWLAMVLVICYRYVKFGTADGLLLGVVVTLATALFGFAQQTQTAKLAIDAKNTGTPSSISSTPLSSNVSTNGAATQ